MSAPSSTAVQMPWVFEGRHHVIEGNVTLGGRWPRVSGFRCTDARTGEDLELLDAERDATEELLIEEAQRMWRAP